MTQQGWWQASDGNWYPPESHPDPAYRARFVPATPPAPTVPLGMAPPSAPGPVTPPVQDAPAPGFGPPPATGGFGQPPVPAGPGFGPPSGPPSGPGGPGGPGVQPLASPAPSSGGSAGKVVLIAVLAVVALLVAGVGVVVLTRGGGDGEVAVADADTETTAGRSSSASSSEEETAPPTSRSVTTRAVATTEKAPSTTKAAVAGSREQPLALGQTFTLRDPAEGDVEVTINAFVADADAAMAGANMFNQPPAAGSRYTLVNATFTYRAGTEKTSAKGITFAVAMSAFGTSAVEIPSYSCVAVPPDAINSLAEVLDGGTVAGNTCFLMPVADATGPLLLRVEESLCFQDCDEFWIKLQ